MSTSPNRPGLPSAASVVAVKDFAPVERGPSASRLTTAADDTGAATAYRIIRTVEVDAYETSPDSSAVASFDAPQPVSDEFKGTSRKAAKIGISAAPTETFADVRDLIATLPAHEEMKKRKDIRTDATSGRVDKEDRNVCVSAFLYAASREDDRDYHLIVGRDPALSPSVYMTMELSGLPPSDSPHFARLDAARKAYKAFFASDLPGESYDFYDPPVPIEVEGSLFWDKSHADGGRPGPQSLRPNMPVVWEVHPISSIVFEP